MSSPFEFKRFSIVDDACAMKLGTDAVILGAWVDIPDKINIIDAGCGCGILSLMLAQRSSTAKITAIDIDREACSNARINFEASPFAGRISLVCDDILKSFPNQASPKLIISNPPFFTEEIHSPDKMRALARHGEGFNIRKLIELSAAVMNEDDSLAFISTAEAEDDIEYQLSLNRLTPVHKTTVVSREGKKPFRILWQAEVDSKTRKLRKDTLLIRDKSNCYTIDYINLTSPFYLHLK